MRKSDPSRYELVSRRAMLKTSVGTGAYLLLAGSACAPDDAKVFAGATVDTAPPTSASTTTAPTTTSTAAETTTATALEVAPESTDTTAVEAPAESSSTDAQQPLAGVAVNGEMVISFTYTQGLGGKNERPYIAVWIEDSVGDLAQTVSLWYEQGRRGARWLDHLTRWHEGDTDRVAAGGVDNAATISSATRAAGANAVVWDGTINGTPAAAGDYFVCIEAAREEGPHSLIREPFTLTGSLAETALPDTGELSLATVRIDA